MSSSSSNRDLPLEKRPPPRGSDGARFGAESSKHTKLMEMETQAASQLAAKAAAGSIASTTTLTKSTIPEPSRASNLQTTSAWSPTDDAAVAAEFAALEQEITQGAGGAASAFSAGDDSSIGSSDDDDSIHQNDVKSEITALPEAAPPVGDPQNDDNEHSHGGLAVAVPIPFDNDDDEESRYLPTAAGVEYDPDAKPPPLYQSRWFWMYVAIAVVILSAAAVGVALGVQSATHDGIATPSPAPIPYRETLGIRDRIQAMLGSEQQMQLDDASTPYARALQWITNDDPMQLMPNNVSFMQRYVASYLYFATSVEHPWSSCNPLSIELKEDEMINSANNNNSNSTNNNNNTDTIEQDPISCLFQSLNDPDQLTFTSVPWIRWLSNITECAWAGISCDSTGQIKNINLAGANLTGTFPEGVKYLPFLQFLGLSFGTLRGTLPTDVISSLKHLVQIEIAINDMTGTIPMEWWYGRNLNWIDVGHNQFTGTIPSDVSNLHDCKRLFLLDNAFNGTIPTEIGLLPSASQFRLYQNRLSGSIPTEITQIRNLYDLRLGRNFLTGTLPTELGKLSRLAYLQVEHNTLTGMIPDVIYDGTMLQRLDVSHCNFTGTISPNLASLSSDLVILRFNGNNFTGSVPSELGQLSYLEFLMLQDNHLIGTMPSTVCDLRGPDLLQHLFADCAIDPMLGMAEIDCPVGCCTDCCQADGSNCIPNGT